jgi:hypothetical protein
MATIDCYQVFWLLSLPLSPSLEKLVSPNPDNNELRCISEENAQSEMCVAYNVPDLGESESY